MNGIICPQISAADDGWIDMVITLLFRTSPSITDVQDSGVSVRLSEQMIQQMVDGLIWSLSPPLLYLFKHYRWLGFGYVCCLSVCLFKQMAQWMVDTVTASILYLFKHYRWSGFGCVCLSLCLSVCPSVYLNRWYSG